MTDEEPLDAEVVPLPCTSCCAGEGTCTCLVPDADLLQGIGGLPRDLVTRDTSGVAGVYSFNEDAAKLHIELVEAELVDDPCQCVCGDCQQDRHCDRASCAQPDQDGPVAAMVVSDTHVSLAVAERQPDGHMHVDAVVRMRPTGRECWWRLYSTPTSFMRQHQDHGVLAVYAHRHNVHALVLDIEGHGRHELSALAWRVNDTDPSRTGQKELGNGKPQGPAKPGPDSIDLLTEFPPILPGKPRHWQQMTQPGQLKHPGDNREKWEFSDQWWQGGTGVQFEQAYTYKPQHHTTRRDRPAKQTKTGLTDQDLAAQGFTTLGQMARGLEKKDDQ